jgi:hypothetical protein
VSTPPDGESFEPLEPARPDAALRAAVGRYEENGSPGALDEAFALAAAAVAVVRGERAGVPPGTDEVRWLFDELPDFERLVSLAAGEAEQAANAAGERLWQWLGFRTPPPRWDAAERSRARLLVACACAPLDGRGAQWLGPRLQRLSAARWADLIVEGLREADEEWWRGALGERYESVRQRCAPRTSWRTRGLAVLPGSDARTRTTLHARLERWLSAGGELTRLPGELEASLVQSRTPPRLA